ncbi:hypothetical protein FB45DRAFT_1057104 [Roridomyces roridus]|uniref:Cyclic nucleotide-binding domain-containing protein n=1 Tax=Roridomyces roridus TaxID=1738132 RepID=A0AAD7C0B8_9AGAR|nr:hypothetical protein FB45DRAFT_1057104 [Roridomyces roridus]
MARHPKLYFIDGSLILKAGDGSDTLYNVYRGTMIASSEFFQTMLSLPQEGMQVLMETGDTKSWLQQAKDLGLDGSCDEKALTLPPQFRAQEIEVFLDFMFTQGWMVLKPSPESLCAILKLSHYFVVQRGIDWAKNGLDSPEALLPVMRLSLGFAYGFGDWVRGAFDALFSIPINDFEPAEEYLIGSVAFLTLAKVQQKVLETRIDLAFAPVVVNHSNSCSNHAYCQMQWDGMWKSTDGVLGALLRDEEPGCLVLAGLPSYPHGAMNVDAQELIRSGNAAYKELLRSNIQSQEEYTNLVRGYLRVTEYCQYIVGLYADLRASLPDDVDASPWQFDPQQPALREAHLDQYQLLLRISPELQWSV